MAKKLDINGIVQQPSVDRQYVDYQMSMNKYNRGLENDVYAKGSREDQLDFVESAFEARIAGAHVLERTGKSLPVPSLDAEHGVTWGTEMASKGMLTKQSGVEQSSENSLSRYERAARVLGVDLSEEVSKDAGVEFGK